MRRVIRLPKRQLFGIAATLLVAIVAFAALTAAGDTEAAGPPLGSGLARAIEVQEAHTDALMARAGVVGTAVGLTAGGQPAVLVLVESAGVRGFPSTLDGVPVRIVVTGLISALAPGPCTGPPSQRPDECSQTGPGITVSPTSGLVTTETGGADTFTVVLDTAPTADVTIGLSSSNETEGIVSDATLIFTELNWSEAQVVTVTGINDTLADGDIGYTIVTGAAASGDTAYGGLPVADVSVTNRDDDTVIDCSTATSVDTEARYRPACIGLSTGHPDITAGTIGARVTNGTNVYALSNNHVYADVNQASIGDNVLQPGAVDGGVDPTDAIGTLAGFVPIDFSGGNNFVDAAIALSSTGNLGNATPSDGYGTPSSTTVAPELNMAVVKYGRTTGQTTGGVFAISATVDVNYGGGSVARFVNQIMISSGSFSAGGDSGSLIVTNDASHNPVGLLFAGSSTHTIASPIQEVLDRLSVTIDGPARTPIDQPPPSDTISIESVTYSAAGGGGKHLYITVALDDGAGSPVTGASVSVSVDPDSDPETSNAATGTATTGADGTVTFVWRKAPSGCYTTTVTAISPAGWDGDQADLNDPFPMGGAAC